MSNFKLEFKYSTIQLWGGDGGEGTEQGEGDNRGKESREW